jgi:hypothetical protein
MQAMQQPMPVQQHVPLQDECSVEESHGVFASTWKTATILPKVLPAVLAE